MFSNAVRAAKIVTLDTVAAFADSLSEQLDQARARILHGHLDLWPEPPTDPGGGATVIHLPVPGSLAASKRNHPAGKGDAS